MPVNTRRRSTAARLNTIINEVFVSPPILAALAAVMKDGAGLHAMKGVNKAFKEAARAEELARRLLQPLRLLQPEQYRLESIEGALRDGYNDFPVYYLSSLPDNLGVAIPTRKASLLFVTPFPSLTQSTLSLACLKANASTNNPCFRGIATVHSLAGRSQIYIAQTPTPTRDTHSVCRLSMSSWPYAYPTARLEDRRSSDGSGSRLQFPSGLAFNGDRLYVTDVFNHRVVVYDAHGLRMHYSFGGFGTAPGRLFTPYGIDVDDSRVYVCDNGNHRVSVHDAGRKGAFVTTFGAAALTQPRDCAVLRARDGSGARWLVVTEALRVQVLRLPDGAPMQAVPLPGALNLWGVTCVENPTGPRHLRVQVVVLDAERPSLYFLSLAS